VAGSPRELATNAAARSAAAHGAWPEAGTCSRCAATCSGGAADRSSTLAARAWRSARLPVARLSYTPARITGCTNSSRPMSPKRSASTSASASRGALSTLTFAISATVPTSSSPATATPSANAVASSRRNRCNTNLATAGGPTVPTASAASAVGETSACPSAAINSRRHSGFPPVARQQASQNAPAAADPNAERTSSALDSLLSGLGRSMLAPGSAASALHSSPSSASSYERAAARTSTGNLRSCD
jgi:hypothetical protein